MPRAFPAPKDEGGAVGEGIIPRALPGFAALHGSRRWLQQAAADRARRQLSAKELALMAEEGCGHCCFFFLPCSDQQESVGFWLDFWFSSIILLHLSGLNSVVSPV